MLQETEKIVERTIPFLPLKSYANITEGNALRTDWESVVPKGKLSYIMGNPPFIANRGRAAKDKGSSFGIMTEEQKADRFSLFGKSGGELDYVACWFKKASLYMEDSSIQCAFVATDSICQGQQVSPLWKPLIEKGIHINFAWTSFKWLSEAKSNATVYVIIIGFSYNNRNEKRLYSNGRAIIVHNINPYLIDALDITVSSRSKPLCNIPTIGIGNKPIDGGNYLFTEAEMLSFIKDEPDSKPFFHSWIGAEEFLYGKKRYCLWLGECSLKY